MSRNGNSTAISRAPHGFCRALALALDPAREPEPLERLGRALGQSVRMVEVIRDLRQDAAMGRVFLPLDWLGEHGISHVELRSEDGGDGARRCLARLAERSRSAWSIGVRRTGANGGS